MPAQVADMGVGASRATTLGSTGGAMVANAKRTLGAVGGDWWAVIEPLMLHQAKRRLLQGIGELGDVQAGGQVGLTLLG